MINLDTLRWGYAFARTDARLDECQRDHIVMEAIQLYLKGEQECKVKTDDFEGTIHRTGRYHLMGDFGGYQYRAEIEAEFGKTSLEFLITEKIKAHLN